MMMASIIKPPFQGANGALQILKPQAASNKKEASCRVSPIGWHSIRYWPDTSECCPRIFIGGALTGTRTRHQRCEKVTAIKPLVVK